MTISLGRDPNGRWLVARVTDELRLDEAVEFVRTARSGEGRYAALLFDARGATTTMTEADVDRMVDEVAAVVRTSGIREHAATSPTMTSSLRGCSTTRSAAPGSECG